MTTAGPAKTSFLLTGGVNDRADVELVAPVIAPGSSPDLLASDNTRLTVVANSCVRAPAIVPVASRGAGAQCYGVVPCQSGKAAVAFFNLPSGGNRQISELAAGYSDGPLRSSQNQAARQTNYRPTQIAQSGAIPSAPASSHIATAYNNTLSQVWYAYMAADPNNVGGGVLYAYATDTSGATIAGPAIVQTIAAGSVVNWVGLTSHGNNGVSVWYLLAGAGLKRIAMTVSGNQMSFSAVDAVLTPGTTNSAVAVCRIDDSWAAIVCPAVGAPVNGLVLAYNISTFATSAVTVAGAMNGFGSQCSVHCDTLGGVTYVTPVWTSNGTNNRTFGNYTWNGSSLSAAFAPVVGGTFGSCAVKYAAVNGVNQLVYAVSDTLGSFAAGTTLDCTFTFVNPATGGINNTVTLPWLTLANAGAQVAISATEMYPLFFLARAYGANAVAGTADYVDDPSIEAYLYFGQAFIPTPVARFGCIRGTVAPARIDVDGQYLTNGAAVYSGSRVYCTYRKANFGNLAASINGYYGRYVALDFGVRQPPMIQDRDGTALCAAALPFQWDGVEVAEIGGPLHCPRLTVATAGGTGPNLAAGSYSFKAVYSWTDSAGLEHRSRPSNTVTVAMPGGTAAVAVVTLPDSLRNGIITGPVSILLYGTPINVSSTYYLQPNAATAVDTYKATYSYVSAAVTTQQQLYSITGANGEELFPQPPAPMHDIATVGSRAYAIDAEVRSRLMVSKVRIAGKGFEFAPALEVNFPSAAGRLMAVREFSGTAIIITENGVYQLSGDGPSNTGVGTFAQPVFLSDMGCDNPDSVVRFPGMLMWQKKNYIVRFDGSSVVAFQNINAADTVSGSAVFKNQDEVLLYSAASGTARIYNYTLGRWTNWTVGTPVTCSVNIPTDPNRHFLYQPYTGVLSYMDALVNGVATNMGWTTGWFLPFGDFQDHTVPLEVVFSGRSLSPHTLKIELFVNYEDAATSSVTWTDTQIAALAENSQQRYTVSLQARVMNSRAIKIRITDTLVSGTGGVAPIAVTLVASQEQTESLLNEVALVDGSRQ